MFKDASIKSFFIKNLHPRIGTSEQSAHMSNFKENENLRRRRDGLGKESLVVWMLDMSKIKAH